MKIDYTNVVNSDDVAAARFLDPLDGWHVTLTTIEDVEHRGYLRRIPGRSACFHLVDDTDDIILGLHATSIKEIVIS